MSVNILESEDNIENVPLVRMEDVQPSRDKSYEVSIRDSDDDSVEEVLGTCVVEDIVYDSEYIVDNNDDDSNIGSMVSIKSEDVEEDNSAEMIVPEIVADIPSEKMYEQRLPESSWPTLEILPGGVIQKPDKSSIVMTPHFQQEFIDEGGMMYACAKCSQTFKVLYCLTKHVKWHEDEAKKMKTISGEIFNISDNTSTNQTSSKHAKKQNTNKRKMILVKSNKKKAGTKKFRS